MQEIVYKIKPNKIQCKKCGDIIESIDVHDLKFCSCKSVAVDGGPEYMKRIGNANDYIELSYTRKLAKINTDGFEIIKTDLKQEEVLSQEKIKCPICNSDKITLEKGDGEKMIRCDIIAFVCHNCEKIFEFSNIRYKNQQEENLFEIRQLELLEELKRCVKEDCDFYLEHNECYEFLDYILNLQAELDEANDNATWWHNRYNAIKKQIELKEKC